MTKMLKQVKAEKESLDKTKAEQVRIYLYISFNLLKLLGDKRRIK